MQVQQIQQKIFSCFAKDAPHLLLFHTVTCQNCPAVDEQHSDWWIFTCHPNHSQTFRGMEIYVSERIFRLVLTLAPFFRGMFVSLSAQVLFSAARAELLVVNVRRLPVVISPKKQKTCALVVIIARHRLQQHPQTMPLRPVTHTA